MEKRKHRIFWAALLFLAATVIALLLAFGEPTNESPGSPAYYTKVALPNDASPEPDATPAQRSAPAAGADNEAGEKRPDPALSFEHFTPATLAWVRQLDAGEPVAVSIEGLDALQLMFRPVRVTTEDFSLSGGVDTQLPASLRVYNGREISPQGFGAVRSTIAVVNDSVALAIDSPKGHFILSRNPDSGEWTSEKLASSPVATDGHSAACASGCAHDAQTICEIGENGQTTFRTSLDPQPEFTAAAVAIGAPQGLVEPANAIASAGAPSAIDRSYYRSSPLYDASLVDLVMIWISAKSQTGTSANYNSSAAEYFSIAGRAADVYERQLGFRYLLQELVLLASDTSDPDPELDYAGSDELIKLADWLSDHRPRDTYKWGHAAYWCNVGGSPNGTIGRAWTSGYGGEGRASSSGPVIYVGTSTQERSWGWEVHVHELGHNVGAPHTDGGVMNPRLRSNEENFFTDVSSGNGNETAAARIYEYMSGDWQALNYQFGPAPLRDATEIPFGVDDSSSTPAGATLSFNVINNDLNKVNRGATNNLTLVETGVVFPRAAGSATVSGDNLVFSPAPGFIGLAWVSYTLQGSVGNNGAGWLHRADVTVTVGGDNTLPTLEPTLDLQPDFYTLNGTGEIRFNPLLNDEAKGFRWAGTVDGVAGTNDSSAEAWSEPAFYLTDAVVVQGNGTLSLESVDVVDNGSPSFALTGYLAYAPAGNDPDPVIIEYTARDANGDSASAYIYLSQNATLPVANSFDDWLAINHPTLVGPDATAFANPDGDRLVNLFEYAFGFSPVVADVFDSSNFQLPVLSLDASGSPLEVVFAYRRLEGGSGSSGTGYGAGGIRYTVEKAGALDPPSWGNAGSSVVENPLGSNGDGTETVEVRLPLPSADRSFFRLKVETIAE